MKNYFERCWTLGQHLDRRRAPTPMQTPLRMTEMLRFAWASLKQLLSAQGPAYLQFLSRVLTQHPDRLWDAFALAAKGYHLRKITEQVTAVDNFKRALTREIENLHAEMARRAQDGNTRLQAYVREVVAHVRREYSTIHTDFRHHVDDILQTFLRALEISVNEVHRAMPMRFFISPAFSSSAVDDAVAPQHVDSTIASAKV